MGITIDGSGIISSSTGSISFDDDNLTTTGTIPAAQLTGQVPAANLNNAPDLSADIRFLALQSASDRIALEDGIADPFTDQTDVSVDVAVGNFGGAAAVGNTHSSDSPFAAQRFSTGATGGTVSSVKFWVQAFSFAAGTDIRIETDDGTTTPSGTLVDSNAVLTTSAHSASTALVSEDFPASFTLAANTSYWIVVSRNSTGTYGLYRNTVNGATMGGTGAYVNSFQSTWELGIYVPVVIPGDSSNERFNSSGTFYSGNAKIDSSLGTNIGDMTSGGGLAAAFNESVDAYDAGAKRLATSGNIGKDWGAGVTKEITGVVFRTISNGKIDGGAGTETITITVERSDDASTWTQIYAESGIANDVNGQTFTKLTGFTNTAAARYVRINFSHGGGAETHMDEVEFYGSVIPNMTLLSNSFTADTAPSSAVIGVQVVENESITVNTDLTAEVSRDGGTTFTSCTLVLNTTLGATGTKYYESASTDISSQPTGTSMVYRVKTLNTKDIQVHGVTLKWS